MKNLKARSFIIVLTFLWVNLLLSTSAQPQTKTQQQPRYGGTLRLAEERDGTSIGYPPKQTSIMSQRQVAPAIETLFRIDKTGKPIPWLATGLHKRCSSQDNHSYSKEGC